MECVRAKLSLGFHSSAVPHSVQASLVGTRLDPKAEKVWYISHWHIGHEYSLNGHLPSTSPLLVS
jgi:hypothetical protein